MANDNIQTNFLLQKIEEFNLYDDHKFIDITENKKYEEQPCSLISSHITSIEKNYATLTMNWSYENKYPSPNDATACLEFCFDYDSPLRKILRDKLLPAVYKKYRECLHSHFSQGIIKRPNTQIADIDLNTQQIILENDERSPYKKFICADGARREITSKILEKNNLLLGEGFIVKLPTPDDKHFNYAAVEIQCTEESRSRIQQLSKKVIAPGVAESMILHKHLPLLKKLGWKRPYPPTLYIQVDQNTNVFYLTGEFPDNYVRMPKSEDRDLQMRKYAAAILVIEYEGILKVEDFNLKENLLSETYNLDHLTALREIQIGDNEFAVGDAHLNPNFLFGHGVFGALQDVFSLAKACFPGNMTSYSSKMEQLSKQSLNRREKYFSLNKEYQDYLYYYVKNLTHRKVLEKTAKILHSFSSLSKKVICRLPKPLQDISGCCKSRRKKIN